MEECRDIGWAVRSQFLLFPRHTRKEGNVIAADSLCRPDLNNPPTFRGWDSERA